MTAMTTQANSVSVPLPFDATGIAKRFGTPTWVYDAATLERRIADLTREGVTVRYAQKANSNLALLTIMRSRGVLVDAVTAGEVRRGLAVGYAPEQIVFTADLFDDDAIEIVRETGCPVNCGSSDMIGQLADAGLQHIPVTLRLNPGFGHGHSQKVNTGGTSSKHGIWHTHLPRCLELGKQHGVNIRGLHFHIGSGADFDHLAQVCDAMVDAAKTYVEHQGPGLEVISTGGGLPIPYRKEDASRIDLDRFFEMWALTRKKIEIIVGRDVELEVEPGRYLVAECGYLVTKVRALKEQGDGDEAVKYLLIDAGFNDLIRPAMYGAYHHLSVVPADGRTLDTHEDVVVAGPLCESCDVFTQEDGGFVEARRLPAAKVGDLLVIHDAGAYGMAMSSNYNSRRIAAETLIVDGQTHEVRRRQSFDDLTKNEVVPAELTLD
ncbi:MAG: diaminopimelate decarboxylase [Planctomycetota bacterium]